jgi:chromosome segregation ATPase
MTQAELFEQLQRLQIENATLQDRYASLKQQLCEDESPAEENERESYVAEIVSIKERISAEQREMAELKRELDVMISAREDLQRRIEEENFVLALTFGPLLQAEEAQTQSFYDNVLAKCEGIDIQQLRSLVDGVQTKRRAVSDATDENQKIHQVIAFNKTQTDPPAALQPMAFGTVERVVFPAVESAAPGSNSTSPKGPRRRVSFKPKTENA